MPEPTDFADDATATAEQLLQMAADDYAAQKAAEAARALPQGRPGETCGEYALRLRAAARGMR